MMVHDGKKQRPFNLPINFQLLQSLPEQLQQQTRSILIHSELVTMANIKLGMRVQKRLDWPQFQYGVKGIHPPANKKGSVIAYSDAQCNKFGQTTEFINRQL